MKIRRCFAALVTLSDVDAYNRLGTSATAGFIAGGAALGAGGVVLLTPPKANPRPEASVTPVLGPGYAGAQGRF